MYGRLGKVLDGVVVGDIGPEERPIPRIGGCAGGVERCRAEVVLFPDVGQRIAVGVAGALRST